MQCKKHLMFTTDRWKQFDNATTICFCFNFIYLDAVTNSFINKTIEYLNIRICTPSFVRGVLLVHCISVYSRSLCNFNYLNRRNRKKKKIFALNHA